MRTGPREKAFFVVLLACVATFGQPAVWAETVSISFDGVITSSSDVNWNGLPISGVVSFDQDSFTPQNADTSAGQDAMSGPSFEWRQQLTGGYVGLPLLPHMFNISVRVPWGLWQNHLTSPDYLYEFQDIYNDSTGYWYSDRWLPFWYQSFVDPLPDGNYREYMDAMLYAEAGDPGVPSSLISSTRFSGPIDLSQATLASGSVGDTTDIDGVITRQTVGFRLTSVTVTSIPEPATNALLGVGLVGLAATRRRVLH